MRKPDQVNAMTQAMNSEAGRPFTKAEVTAFVDAFSALIQRQLEEHGHFTLQGIGRFSITQRSERVGRNPLNGQMITYPACKRVKFAASKMLRDALNGS